jgi:hypothetical protein
MQEYDLFTIFVGPLHELGISYMVTGAVASIVYGEPRLTNDVDLVLELRSEDVDKIISKFPADLYYVPPPEVIRLEMNRSERGHFNIIHHQTGLRADIYLVGNDSFTKWAMKNCRRISIGEQSYHIAPPEYVIILKLEYYREGGSDKHLRDIRSIMEISPEEIDTSLLEHLIQERSLSDVWQKLPG